MLAFLAFMALRLKSLQSAEYLRSPVVYKNHVCEKYFPPTKNQAKISIPVHSVAK